MIDGSIVIKYVIVNIGYDAYGKIFSVVIVLLYPIYIIQYKIS